MFYEETRKKILKYESAHSVFCKTANYFNGNVFDNKCSRCCEVDCNNTVKLFINLGWGGMGEGVEGTPNLNQSFIFTGNFG